jgi:hypothetical protein
MSRARLGFLLLTLCVLLPVRGLAQTAPPLVPAPAPADPYDPKEGDPEPEEEPPGELIPRQWTPSESAGLKAPRIVLEVLGGSLLGAAASLPGAFIAAVAAFCDGCESDSQFLGGVGLAFAGLTLGTAVGIKGMGSLLEWEGRFLAALAGTSIGALAGLGAGLVIAWGAGSELWFIPILVGPLVGGIIAYESSHTNALEERSSPSRTGMSMIPVVGVSPRGGIIGGLAGRF